MMLGLALALAALGAVYWLLVSVAGVRTMRALTIAADEPRMVGPTPSLSVVIAARDEERTLRHEVDRLAALRYPDIEFVFVNDRSRDATGARLDELAAADPRVRVVHLDTLPAGWLGKVHALEQGRRVARGAWLLFTDADVELSPDLPHRALALAERERLDALALLPSVHSGGVLVAGVVATFSRWLVVGGRLWRPADPERREAFGVGACNFVRSSALEAAGGLEWLRMDIADDAALGELVASRGGRTMLASGVRLVRVQWQESVRGMTQGFEKYGGTGGVGSVPSAIALASLATVGEVGPWVALALGLPIGAWALVAAAATTIVASTLVGVWVMRRADAPVRGLLAGPLAPMLVWWMQVRSALLEARRGGVVWRDTFYSTAELRAGKRYRLPSS